MTSFFKDANWKSDKIIQYDKNTYDRYNVIKPPQDPVEDFSVLENSKSTRMVIDSFMRDTNLFPSPNKYEIEFDEHIDDVTSIELINVKMPLSSYLINSNFNALTFTTNNDNYTVNLPPGNYDPTTALATELQTQMNSAVDQFVVTYVAAQDNYIIRSSSPFSINFSGTNTLAKLFGFNNGVVNSVSNSSYTDGFSNVIQAPYRINPNYNDYAVMYIDQCDLFKSPYNAFDKAFAIIGQDYYTNNIAESSRIKKGFDPPVRLQKLKVRFYDKYYNPYDFQNQDHRFEIVLTSSKSKKIRNLK